MSSKITGERRWALELTDAMRSPSGGERSMQAGR